MYKYDKSYFNKRAKSRVKEFINNLLRLDAGEQEFLQRFKGKEYLPELLFENVDIIERIKNHPMAIWKTREKD